MRTTSNLIPWSSVVRLTSGAVVVRDGTELTH
jgi:hypothetical protein